MLKCHKLLLLLLTFSIAHAQEPEVEDEPEIRRYAVEVIIFRYAQEVGTGSEIFIPEEATIEEIELRGAVPPVIEVPAAADPTLAETDTLRFMSDIRKLEEDEHTMGDILGRLERLEVYEPIMHFGWSQSTWPEHDKEPVMLSRFAQPPEGLQGELTLYLSRFLHLVVDLQMDKPGLENAVPDDPMTSYGDYRTLNEIRRQPAPVRFRIEEDRIFRSGELRYFDHPRFGVLARVSRVEEAEDGAQETGADEAGELLGYPVE